MGQRLPRPSSTIRGLVGLFVEALNRDDWPIVMAILFITAILVVIATLVGDILYTLVDPRIRFE